MQIVMNLCGSVTNSMMCEPNNLIILKTEIMQGLYMTQKPDEHPERSMSVTNSMMV